MSVPAAACSSATGFQTASGEAKTYCFFAVELLGGEAVAASASAPRPCEAPGRFRGCIHGAPSPRVVAFGARTRLTRVFSLGLLGVPTACLCDFRSYTRVYVPAVCVLWLVFA